MKVCYLCADRGISLTEHNGARTNIRNLIRTFTAQGHEGQFVTPSTNGGEDFGVPIVRIPASETLDTLWSDAHERVAANPNAEQWALHDRVRLLGPLTQHKIVDRYHSAHLFVLPCIVGSDGNRDGLPQCTNQLAGILKPFLRVFSEHYENGIRKLVRNVGIDLDRRLRILTNVLRENSGQIAIKRNLAGSHVI